MPQPLTTTIRVVRVPSADEVDTDFRLADHFNAEPWGFATIASRIERTTGTPQIIDWVAEALAKRQTVRLGRFIAQGDPLGKGCGADLYTAPNTPDGRATGKGYEHERYTQQPFRAVAAFFVHRWLRDW